jgi:iron complex transport system substrate-binding protein
MPGMKILLPLFGVIPLLALGIALRPPVASAPHVARDDSGLLSVTAPHRIVSYASVLEALATIDESASRVVATPDYLRLGVRENLISRVFPALASISAAGNGTVPDPEGIMALNADTVIAWHGILGNLRQIGFPNILQVRQPGAEVGTALDETWQLLGQVLHKQARSNFLIDSYHNKMTAIQTKYAATRPLRVIVIIPIRGQWRIGGRRFYLNHLLKLVGAVNVAASPADGPADTEQIFAYDPDVILLLNTPGGASPEDFYENRAWSPVRAVWQRRVYTMPTRSTYNAPVDEPLLAQWLVDVFQAGEKERTRDSFTTTYATVYDYLLSDTDLAWALREEENKASTGYARFLGARQTRFNN